MKKFFAPSLLIFGLVISAFGIQQTQAASNHQDTPFSFLFMPGVVNQTDPRDKLNSTSAYMKATSISGPGVYEAWVALLNGTDISHNHHYNISANREYFLINYAAETYGTPVSVRIKARGVPNETYRASGVWSPDSVR
ncbi:hypothetical protein J9303_04705 [Bacillaceae bacterium Marseille-Q3522]|nr:hypothetical protein [Bacillaceae bacterium Marseille-Q3522]